MSTAALQTEIRAHIDSEVKVLTWIQADAEGEEEPGDVAFTDLDSFTFIQLVLSLEAAHDLELLEDLGEFRGSSFDDLTDFIVERVLRKQTGAEIA